jgi:TonB family protein
MRLRYVIFLILVFSYTFGLIGTAQTQQSTSVRKVVQKIEPRYPELARRMNLGGTVKVTAIVASDGNVKKVEPVGGSPLLVEAAEQAVSQWRFAPGGESKETIELKFVP